MLVYPNIGKKEKRMKEESERERERVKKRETKLCNYTSFHTLILGKRFENFKLH
jgi:hypothetical protein